MLWDKTNGSEMEKLAVDKLRNPVATSGNRTSDLPACIVAPQPSTLARAPDPRVAKTFELAELIF
jgi:hypothetical protein